MLEEKQLGEEMEAETEEEQKSEPGGEEKKDSKWKWARRFLFDAAFLLCIAVIGFYFMPTFVLQRTIVDGKSMENNFHDEENILVSKLSYRTHAPERFDVITFYPFGRTEDNSFSSFLKEHLYQNDVEKDDYYIKRVIGLPGETIQIVDSVIYINGEELEEHYGKEPIKESGIAAVPIVLGEDEYFVLGDNRGNSTDSREIGPVKAKNIAGKVVWH